MNPGPMATSMPSLPDLLLIFIKNMAPSLSWPSSAKITPMSWPPCSQLGNSAASSLLSIFMFLATSWSGCCKTFLPFITHDLSFTEIRYLASDLCNVALSFLDTTDTHALNFPLNNRRFKQLEKFLNNIVIYHLQKLDIWPVICATLHCLTLVLPTPVP